MKKILFYGDSITDAMRYRDSEGIYSFGCGYVIQIAGRFFEKNPTGYEIINKGISGNRIVDLYARIKNDLWNENPDVISILIGINDIWHEMAYKNGVDAERFDKIYRILLEDTLARLPEAKIIICEPFVLPGSATDGHPEFDDVPTYQAITKKIADDFGLTYVPLQKKLEEAALKYGNEAILSDGVHPAMLGTIIIANEWLKAYEKIEK